MPVAMAGKRDFVNQLAGLLVEHAEHIAAGARGGRPQIIAFRRK